MENSKTNLNVVQRFYDAYNNKREAILNEVIADNYVDYGHQPPGRGLQGARSDHQDIARAFEDARFDIDEMFGADDRVVVRWTLHATNTGPFCGDFTDTKEGRGSRNQPLSAPRRKDHGDPQSGRSSRSVYAARNDPTKAERGGLDKQDNFGIPDHQD